MQTVYSQSSKTPDRRMVRVGEITFNAMPDEEAIKTRQATKEGDNKYAVYTQSLGEGTDPIKNGNIAVDEIAFAQRADVVKRQAVGGSMARYKPLIMTSFNRMTTNVASVDVPSDRVLEANREKRQALDDIHREQLFSRIYPAGVVSEYWTFQEPSQKKNGLAPAQRVSCSVLNTGLKALRAGALLAVNVPPIDHGLRQEYLDKRKATNSASNGLPHDKLVLITEEFHPQNAAWTAFRHALKAETDATRANPANTELGDAQWIFMAAVSTSLDYFRATDPAEQKRIATEALAYVIGTNKSEPDDILKGIRQSAEIMIKATARIYYAASAHVIGRVDSDGLPGRHFQGTFYF